MMISEVPGTQQVPTSFEAKKGKAVLPRQVGSRSAVPGLWSLSLDSEMYCSAEHTQFALHEEFSIDVVFWGSETAKQFFRHKVKTSMNTV